MRFYALVAVEAKHEDEAQAILDRIAEATDGIVDCEVFDRGDEREDFEEVLDGMMEGGEWRWDSRSTQHWSD